MQSIPALWQGEFFDPHNRELSNNLRCLVFVPWCHLLGYGLFKPRVGRCINLFFCLDSLSAEVVLLHHVFLLNRTTWVLNSLLNPAEPFFHCRRSQFTPTPFWPRSTHERESARQLTLSETPVLASPSPFTLAPALRVSGWTLKWVATPLPLTAWRLRKKNSSAPEMFRFSLVWRKSSEPTRLALARTVRMWVVLQAQHHKGWRLCATYHKCWALILSLKWTFFENKPKIRVAIWAERMWSYCSFLYTANKNKDRPARDWFWNLTAYFFVYNVYNVLNLNPDLKKRAVRPLPARGRLGEILGDSETKRK